MPSLSVSLWGYGRAALVLVLVLLCLWLGLVQYNFIILAPACPITRLRLLVFVLFRSPVEFSFGLALFLALLLLQLLLLLLDVNNTLHLTILQHLHHGPAAAAGVLFYFFCCTAFIFRFLPGFRFVAAAANRPQKNIKSENLISNNSGEFIVRLPCFPPESICICGFVSVSVAAHPWISPGCIHTDWLGVFSGCEFRIFSIFRSLAWLMGALHLANTFICRA